MNGNDDLKPEIEWVNELFIYKIKETKRYNSYYKQTETIFEQVKREMSVHVNGDFPHTLIRERRPNEPEDIFAFRKSNYEAITKPVMSELIDSLYRIFNIRNFDIKTSPELEYYIKENKFNGKSFISWIQYDIMREMITDPNAVMAIIPYSDDFSDKSKYVMPKIELFSSCDIVSEDGMAYIYRDKKDASLVFDGQQNVWEGEVYWVFTDNNIYKAKQTGSKFDYNFVIELYYITNLGYMPVKKLGGIWNMAGYYESFFNGFIPYGNEAIKQYSDWQATMITSAYPIREVASIECTAPGCINGSINNNMDDPCQVCHGKGYVIPSSPYGVYTKPPSLEPAKEIDQPILTYISPPTEIIAYSQKAWQDLLKLAKESVHLSYVEEAQSGAAKAIDRENQYAMIMKISNQIFDLIEFTLVTCEHYLNITTPFNPIIIRPTEFSIKTDADLLMDISEMKKAGVSNNIVNEVTTELLKSRFATNPLSFKTQMLLKEYDPLYSLTIDEKIAGLAAGIITKRDWQKNMFAAGLLERWKREVRGLIDISNYSQIMSWLDKELDKMIPKETVKMPLVENDGANGDME